MALWLAKAPGRCGLRNVNDAFAHAFPFGNKTFPDGFLPMIQYVPTIALAALFAAGLWLVQRPWALRQWRRDAEWGHRANASLYEAHYGEAPPWLDQFTSPAPPRRAIRFTRLFRVVSLVLMAFSAVLLYHRLSRSGVI